MRTVSWMVCALALGLVGCDDRVIVQLKSGPQRFEVDASALALPEALRDESGRIASIECDAPAACPGTAEVPIACEAGVCNPGPRIIDAPVGDVVDVDVLAADAVEVLGTVEQIELVEARYTVPTNRLSVDLPEVEIFWAPESATAIDPAMGGGRLGVVPAVPAGTMPSGTVELDPEGGAALSEYLLHTARRVVFFARMRVDLEPGGAFPEGSAVLTVDVAVRVTGSLL